MWSNIIANAGGTLTNRGWYGIKSTWYPDIAAIMVGVFLYIIFLFVHTKTSRGYPVSAGLLRSHMEHTEPLEHSSHVMNKYFHAQVFVNTHTRRQQCKLHIILCKKLYPTRLAQVHGRLSNAFQHTEAILYKWIICKIIFKCSRQNILNV